VAIIVRDIGVAWQWMKVSLLDNKLIQNRGTTWWHGVRAATMTHFISCTVGQCSSACSKWLPAAVTAHFAPVHFIHSPSIQGRFGGRSLLSAKTSSSFAVSIGLDHSLPWLFSQLLLRIGCNDHPCCPPPPFHNPGFIHAGHPRHSF